MAGPYSRAMDDARGCSIGGALRCQTEGYEPHLTAVDAIRIQRELKYHDCEPIAAERDGRMFAAEYASPWQLLRRVATAGDSTSTRHHQQRGRRRTRRRSSLSLLSSPYCRAEPYATTNKNRGTARSLVVREEKELLFPSIAARLENDIALGLAVSLWKSGNVVGQCDDRLAHLLVLSATIMRCARAEVRNHNSGEGHVPVELREAFMGVIEHLVRLERVAVKSLLLTPPKTRRQQGHEQEQQSPGSLAELPCGEGDAKVQPVTFAVAVDGAARVLKGLVEPSTLAAAAVTPTWRYSLVRTAADVPNRYEILDAMTCVMRPGPRLIMRRTFCAVARQLALDVLRAAGDGTVGLRGGAAALRILQHINTRPLGL
ncbi:hypothetical protein DQ04_20041000, partial [Trypanosoma grayi]|uniref:hypothetical protein n=1 Tax=Trypanosoma grayi TaxID=71804 RepID=UPI0004F4AB65